MLVPNILLICIGLCLSVIGVLNCLGDIRSVHWYNRTRITEDTRRPYGRAVGTGSLIIGLTMVLAAVLEFLIGKELIYLITLPGSVAGLAFILYGQFKYNKGIF